MYNWKQKYKNNVEVEEQSTQSPPMTVNMVGPEPQLISAGNIRVFENKIFFYDEINNATMLELNRILTELDAKLNSVKTILGDGYTPIIHLHLNTPGGSLLDAFSCVDTIRSVKADVYTYIDGWVASAGTLISAVGSKRFMGQHAHLLIHQLSGLMFGTFAEMEDQFLNSNNLMKLLKDYYKKYTKVPMKKLEEILRKDLYLTADECKQFGIVDEIL